MAMMLAVLFSVCVVVRGHRVHLRSARAIISFYLAQPLIYATDLQRSSYCVQSAHVEETFVYEGVATVYDEDFEQLAILGSLGAGTHACMDIHHSREA